MPPVLAVVFAMALVTLALARPAAATGDLVFKDHGRAVKSLSAADLAALVPPETVRTHEFHEGEERLYRAVPMTRLLQAVYGDVWKKADEILFACADGYQASIPVGKFLQHPGYLAVARADQDRFTLVNKLQNNELVELGPYYLVWDNLKDPALQDEGVSDQPYQVVGLDLIDFATRFPGMAPPAGATAQARRGFLAYRKGCMACHSINGEGGAKSIELNYPVSVTEYIKDAYLRQWIDRPTSLRFNATMPPLNPSAKNRAALLDDIVAYLRAMATRKVPPTK